MSTQTKLSRDNVLLLEEHVLRVRHTRCLFGPPNASLAPLLTTRARTTDRHPSSFFDATSVLRSGRLRRSLTHSAPSPASCRYLDRPALQPRRLLLVSTARLHARRASSARCTRVMRCRMRSILRLTIPNVLWGHPPTGSSPSSSPPRPDQRRFGLGSSISPRSMASQQRPIQGGTSEWAVNFIVQLIRSSMSQLLTARTRGPGGRRSDWRGTSSIT